MALNRIQTDGIEDGAVDTSKILDGILGTADITNDTLTNAKFSNSAAIPTSKLSGLATSATTDTTNATNITSGSLATARVNVGTTAGKILQVDGSGNMPAIDGSLLTGVESFTKSASDPTISTNPSGGVGSEWVNSTSGEIYICTDATAGANVWTNVGAGSGDILLTYYWQGSNYGYMAGAYGGPSNTWMNTIERFSLTSDGNAADVGDLTRTIEEPAGASSSTHGFVAGGGTLGGTGQDVVDKFAFASSGNATDHGDITEARFYLVGAFSETHGYTAGGEISSTEQDIIDKYAFASNVNGADVGNLTDARSRGNCMTGPDYGYYNSGGYPGPTAVNTIERFSFTTDGNAVDVGDMGSTDFWQSGTASSATHGYTAGGGTAGGGSYINRIERHAFAASANASDVGDITVARKWPSSSTSTTHGYIVGGDSSGTGPGGGARDNTIDKFAFAASSNATDVGNLTSDKGAGAHNTQN